MFVGSNDCGEIYDSILNKSLPKGNISERFVFLTSQSFDNPKGKLAYKKLFDMSNEKYFVEGGTYAIPMHFTGEILQLIQQFYKLADASEYAKNNQQLIKTFMRCALQDDQLMNQADNVLFMTIMQNEFIKNLQDVFQRNESLTNNNLS